MEPRNIVCEVFVSQISASVCSHTNPEQVSLMGIIVDTTAAMDKDLIELAEVAKYGKPHIYKLDDGTGVLPVLHFVKRDGKELERAATVLKSTGKLAAKAAQNMRENFDGFPIGTLVNVTGRYRYRRGEVTVIAQTVQKVNDPNYEASRILGIVNK